MTIAGRDKVARSCCGKRDGHVLRPIHYMLALILIGLGCYTMVLDAPLAPSGGVRLGELGALFVLGLLTGLHCIGMCGGMVLIYREGARSRGLSPLRMHSAYAVGKTLAYTALGAFFGLMGGLVSFSQAMRGTVGILFGSGITLVGLGMIWPLPFNRLLSNASRAFTRRMPRVTHPFSLGLLNGAQFLCGPLQAMYLLAAGSADPFNGALLLFTFGLGTLPAMIAFAFFADLALPGLGMRASARFLARTTALIVVIFGMATLNRGLALVGSGYDLGAVWARIQVSDDEGNAGQADTQVIRMKADERGWSETSLVLQQNLPTRWIIEAEKVTHCNKTLTVPALGLTHDLKTGINIIEFTPRKAGIYTFTCWMGMMKGTLHVRKSSATVPMLTNAHSSQEPKGI